MNIENLLKHTPKTKADTHGQNGLAIFFKQPFMSEEHARECIDIACLKHTIHESIKETPDVLPFCHRFEATASTLEWMLDPFGFTAMDCHEIENISNATMSDGDKTALVTEVVEILKSKYLKDTTFINAEFALPQPNTYFTDYICTYQLNANKQSKPFISLEYFLNYDYFCQSFDSPDKFNIYEDLNNLDENALAGIDTIIMVDDINQIYRTDVVSCKLYSLHRHQEEDFNGEMHHALHSLTQQQHWLAVGKHHR